MKGQSQGSPMKERFRFLVDLFKRTFERFDAIEGFRLGAAFSYYATFSIFPLVLLIVTVTGFIIGDDVPARDRLLAAVATADSPMRAAIDKTLTAMQESRSGRGIGAAIAVLTLLFSASGAMVELDNTLNKIWKVPPRVGKGFVGTVRAYVQERLSGFALVGGIGLTLLASLVMSSVLAAVANRASETFNASLTPALLRAAEVSGSLLLVALCITAAFHFVPRSRPPWKDVVGGAVLTTVLLTILKTVFATYLSHLTSYSAYGIVGGVLALATWIYLSSQIIFLGATLTRIHCEMTGCAAATKEAETTAAASAAAGTGGGKGDGAGCTPSSRTANASAE